MVLLVPWVVFFEQVTAEIQAAILLLLFPATVTRRYDHLVVERAFLV
jgi:hypothetical protein